MTLNPQQFLYHGTGMDVQGGRLLPAKVHGKGSYWGSTGSGKGQPSEEHAWAIPREKTAWEFAQDRADYAYQQADETNPHPIAPRSRVYALHPNEQMTPGVDIPGELKAPHFDVAHQIDIKPGQQGTFPGVNWNEHVKHEEYLPGDEDANHPSDLSVQFGHHYGVEGHAGRIHTQMHRDAYTEHIDRSLARGNEVMGKRHGPDERDEPLPGLAGRRRY